MAGLERKVFADDDLELQHQDYVASENYHKMLVDLGIITMPYGEDPVWNTVAYRENMENNPDFRNAQALTIRLGTQRLLKHIPPFTPENTQG